MEKEKEEVYEKKREREMKKKTAEVKEEKKKDSVGNDRGFCRSAPNEYNIYLSFLLGRKKNNQIQKIIQKIDN